MQSFSSSSGGKCTFRSKPSLSKPLGLSRKTCLASSRSISFPSMSYDLDMLPPKSHANSETFRWSNQKGVDAIADVFPSIMERHSHVQLICVGPVIDLYGKFSAIKLARMMEVYPGRVFSQPEFTALPQYIFSGADFALMPSRDEPFGLVAVEFGRKGVLCVGTCIPD